MKILVLGGGNSPEREVSLRSAGAVASAARQAGLDVAEADPAVGLSFLDNVSRGTAIFPILHGAGGEDGSIQAELEKRGLVFLGSDSSSSANCFDKWLTRGALMASGIPMPTGDLVSQESYINHPLREQPHVIKVARGGSSIGTLLVADPKAAKPEEIAEIFKLDNKVIIEQLIVGTEITVAVLDKAALPVIEIVPPEDEEFDYENKYNGRTQEICPPRSVAPKVQVQAQKIAEKVHKLMACQHLSRVDLMIDKANNLYVLEINTMPGMTAQSLYPKAAAVAGIPMPELVRRFMDMALADRKDTR